MNNNLTEMVFILDMSGSMSNLTNDTIGGYNSLIEKQKKEPGDALVTTILFDDRYIVLHDRVDIKDVKPLTDKEYCPTGCTAMLDAVGKTIKSIGQKLNNTPEEESLSELTPDEANKYIKDNEFAAGSMLPKVEACLYFLKNNRGNKKAIITSLAKAKNALEGKTGTVIKKK